MELELVRRAPARRDPELRPRGRRQGHRRGRQAHHRAPREAARAGQDQDAGSAGRVPGRPHPGARRRRHQDRRTAGGGERGAQRGHAGQAAQGRHRLDRHDLGQRPRPRPVHLQHPAHRPEQDPARGAGRDLPHDASGRAADQGRRAQPVLQPVLHLRALRPVGRGPDEVQPPRRPQGSHRRLGAVRLPVLQGAHRRGLEEPGRGQRPELGHPRRDPHA